MSKVAAIVPAAGKGLRLPSKIDKPYIKLQGKPIIVHTLLALSRNKNIKEIIVAINKERMIFAENIFKKYGLKKIRVVEGGKERKDSVLNALKEVSSDMEYVLIHDAVRPFIEDVCIERCIKEAKRNKASILACPVKPTLKKVKKGFIENTLDREDIWEAQTPQVFKKDLLIKAYKAIKRRSIPTDDSMLLENIGIRPKIVLGSYSNIKITTKEDLDLAGYLLKKR